MKSGLISLLLVILICLPACRKEAEIAGELEPGRICAVASYRLLALNNIAEEIAFRRGGGFLTVNAVVRITDSVYTDGDGWKYLIDFGKGVVCGDGILRRGKCRLLLVDSAFPKLNYTFQMLETDSFAFSAKTGWERIVGSIQMTVENTLSGKLQFALAFMNNSGEVMHADSSASGNPLAVIQAQPNNGGKTGETFSGSWISRQSAGVFAADIHELVNTGACYSNWNAGKISVQPSGGGNAFDIDFDPYGNQACDQVFKVSHKSASLADEMTFDAW